MDKENNFVSAVIYIHNSQHLIGYCLNKLLSLFERNFVNTEIICVNDGSSDDSVEIVKSIAKKAHSIPITLVNMSYFHGLEVAMNAGMDLAIGDFVYEFDSTIMDYTESDIMNVYYKALEGYDIVSASPDKPSKLSSRIFYNLYSKYAVYSKSDLHTESFHILSRRVINRIGHMNKTVPYRKAVYAYSGLKIYNIIYTCVPCDILVEHKDIQEDKMRRELAVDSLLLFTNIGYRFSIMMSLIMLVMSVVVSFYTIIAYIISTPADGWTSTILFLAITFFGIFVVLAVIIKYLQLILSLVFKRQQYSIEGIEKITE